MSGVIADFSEGDEVNVKYNGRWYRVNGKFYVFTISHTWYTTTEGRQYNVRENGDTFKENEIRAVK